MSRLFSRLSVKITLGILALITLLAAVTAYLVVQGFGMAQEAAVGKSAAGLKSQAHSALHALAASQARVLAAQFDQASLVADEQFAQVQAELEQLRPAPGGHAFLVDRDGRLVAGSTGSLAALLGQTGGEISLPDEALPRDLTAVADPLLRQSLSEMRRGQNGLSEVVLNNRIMLLAYTPVPELGWSLALAAPVEAATAQSAAVAAAIRADARQTLQRVLVTAVGVFALALAGTVLFTRHLITRPLASLMRGARAVEGGDLAVRIPVTTRDEVGALAGAFNQMAAGLEQRSQERQLLAVSQRRAEQLRVINEVGRRITALLSEEELLDQTQQLIRENFGYYFVSIGLVDGDDLLIRTDCNCERTRLKIGSEGVMGWVAAHGEPLLVTDTAPGQAQITPDAVTPIAGDHTRSELALPIQLKGETIGVLNVESERLNAFGEEDVAILQSLASQLAVALDNARLYEQARRLAALEERQKLARELHDSVSQALYGIALGTRTARTLLGRDPAQAAEPLDYIASLAEAGLAEMRALIFELRPESLQIEGLAAALAKQAEAARARHQLQVTTNFCPEPEASLTVKEALYRVAQEALHNVAKHAQATQVELRLAVEDGCLTLTIRDDGHGFDPSGDFPGHLGLRSMRERLETVGGEFHLYSAPGQGTMIRAVMGD
jgi:signal transduction histidine kinase